MFQALLNWLRSLFWSTALDCALIGLQNAGKVRPSLARSPQRGALTPHPQTSLVNVLAHGQFSQSMIPTIGFNLRKVQKGNVTLKLWDIGGQPRFRSMWERYCRGVSAIVWVLDSADPSTFPAARAELHALLEKGVLGGIPLLVLANKNDVEGCAQVEEVIGALDLASVANREVSCYSVSAKSQRNLDITLTWLMKRS
ncbi:SPOSA6832_02760 [Sporobolomyces salmonicolor]|uniref:SPOSA6832_02760-mRNA-1:cds n=1 Tax=Sporidiobolus salmonicolor TaxID=5005 RepID=A0A0D6EM58_SPOSA|nr:SPOSA6832_02760 [Sporobolomyces salmonicolor]